MHTENLRNPTIPRRQSLFRLPALLILILYLYSFLTNLFFYYDSSSHEYSSIYNDKAVFVEFLISAISSIFYLIPYFIIAVILFIDSKLHQLTKNTFLIICAISIIYFVLRDLSSYLLNLITQNVTPSFYSLDDNTSWQQFIEDNYTLIFNFKAFIIFIGVIKFIGLIHKKDRQTYHLDLGNYQHFLPHYTR